MSTYSTISGHTFFITYIHFIHDGSSMYVSPLKMPLKIPFAHLLTVSVKIKSEPYYFLNRVHENTYS